MILLQLVLQPRNRKDSVDRQLPPARLKTLKGFSGGLQFGLILYGTWT